MASRTPPPTIFHCSVKLNTKRQASLSLEGFRDALLNGLLGFEQVNAIPFARALALSEERNLFLEGTMYRHVPIVHCLDPKNQALYQKFVLPRQALEVDIQGGYRNSMIEFVQLRPIDEAEDVIYQPAFQSRVRDLLNDLCDRHFGGRIPAGNILVFTQDVRRQASASPPSRQRDRSSGWRTHSLTM